MSEERNLSKQDIDDLIRSLGNRVRRHHLDIILHPGTSKPSLIRSVLIDLHRPFTSDVITLMEECSPCFISAFKHYRTTPDGEEITLLYLRELFVPQDTPGQDTLVTLISQGGFEVVRANDQIVDYVKYGENHSKHLHVTRFLLRVSVPRPGQGEQLVCLDENV